MSKRPPIYRVAHRVVERHEAFAAKLDIAASAELEYRYPLPETTVAGHLGKAMLMATTVVSAVVTGIRSMMRESEMARCVSSSRGDVAYARIESQDPFLIAQQGFSGLQFDDGTEVSIIEYARTLVELERQWEEQKDSLPPDVVYGQNSLQ